MLDLKTFKSALEQLEEERKIPKEKILEAIEQAMAAAYKKDYGKKGQIIRAKFDLENGKTDFFQVKIVVDESIAILDQVRPKSDSDTRSEKHEGEYSVKETGDERVHFNAEHHLLLEDAKKIKKGVELNDEIIFPLESKEDYGRIAAQTAKQVIIQKIREAERTSIIDEYGTKEGEIISGVVQKVERGNVYVDFNRATGILPAEEQIPGEYWERGRRIRAYLYSVEDTQGIFGSRYLTEVISQRIAYDIRDTLYDHLQRLSFAFYDKNQIGQLMSRASIDVEAARRFFGMGLLNLLQTILLACGVAYLLISLDWRLALITLAFFPVIAWRAISMSLSLAPIWLRVQQRIATLGTRLQESLIGIKVVKAFSQEKEEESKFYTEGKKLYDDQVSAARQVAINMPMMVFLLALPTVLVIWYGGRKSLPAH